MLSVEPLKIHFSKENLGWEQSRMPPGCARPAIGSSHLPHERPPIRCYLLALTHMLPCQGRVLNISSHINLGDITIMCAVPYMTKNIRKLDLMF